MVIKIESEPEEKKRSSLLLLKELGSDCRGYRLVGMKDISVGDFFVQENKNHP